LVVDFEDALAEDTFKFDLSLDDDTFELEDLDNDQTYDEVSQAQDIMSSTSFDTRAVEVDAGTLTVDTTKVTGKDVVI